MHDDSHAKHRLTAIAYGVGGSVLAPEVVLYTGIYPRLSQGGKRVYTKAMNFFRGREIHPETLAYMNHTEMYPVQWAGPTVRVVRETQETADTLIIHGRFLDTRPRNGRLVNISIDGQEVAALPIEDEPNFQLTIPMKAPLPPGKHGVEIRAGWWFVPNVLSGIPDYRPLSWVVKDITLK